MPPCTPRGGYSSNRPAIFKISNVLPVTEQYLDGEYTSQGIHLVLRDQKLITEIERKLSRILFDEGRHPDKYEQHITSVYSFLVCELMSETVLDDSAEPQEEKPSVINAIRAAKENRQSEPSPEYGKSNRKNEPEL